MSFKGRHGATCLVILTGLSMTSCGGGVSTVSPPPPQKATPTVTVTPAAPGITTVQSLAVTLAVSGSNGIPTGSVTLSSGNYTSAAATLANGGASITIGAGLLADGTDTLTATYTPDAASSSTYNGASGVGQVTVAKVTPTVTVLPAAPSITTTQSDMVTVTVSGGANTPPATGSVTLAGGSYTSAATALTNGSVQIVIPAGALAVGNLTLTATYMPDTAGAATYASTTGMGSVMVSLTVPTVTVTPGTSSMVVNQPLTVTVGVSGGNGSPTATGLVTLSGGGYTSSATALTSGSATINISANSLTTGNDTLTASYAPDAASSSIYAGATGTGSVTVSPLATYVLTVDSAAPSSGITISVSPADNNSNGSGTTPFTRTYNAGTQVTLSAALVDGSYSFVSWSGCTSNPVASNCVVMVNANATVTATYNETAVTSITVSPNTATIGTQQQFTATVNGTGSYSSAVTWSVAAPAGSTLSPGDISSSGLYNTPYPAPPTVTVTATSVQNTSISGSVTVTLSPPAATAGPALSVDVNTPNTPSENPHKISPYVYGMNGYFLDSASARIASPGIVRWGGDDISRYNYQTTWTNAASDWYFENYQGAGAMFPYNGANSGTFDGFLDANNSVGSASLGTIPVNGWVSKSENACSFPQSSFPDQVGQNGDAAFNSYNGEECGYGAYAEGSGGCTSAGGCSIYGNSTIAAVTSQPEPPPDITSSSTPAPGSVTTAWADSTWPGGWVSSLVNNANYGAASGGKGVAVWDLDNEPTWWSAVHRDVHPNPFTYDEVTNHGIGTALAIKTADPTALVSGPVIDYWWAYFYSMQDIWNGWSTGPCYVPWGDPTDREAHGGVPLIEYYLQEFSKYSQEYGIRLLDYVDIHGYFAPQYPVNSGNSVAFATAGDTQEQIERMNATRVFWDPTYTDPDSFVAPSYGGYQQPNYITDPNYTTSCTVPAQAPQVIPMMQSWVTNEYPGTKTAIDEYNFGGLESINGAVVQADILGIFGRQDLGMSALWPSEQYSAQGPGNYAFAMYRNYDLANDGATFGDVYLYASSSASGADAEGKLAIYGGQRSTDGAITIMVINKTYGSLTSTISLENIPASSGTTALVYQYSNANLNTIVKQAAVSVTLPSGSGTVGTINYTFPGQSITLFVVPD